MGNLFKKVGSKILKTGKKGKALASAFIVCIMSSAMTIVASAEETVPTFDVGETISGIGPKILSAFGDIVLACIDLAIGMVPIALAFIGATMLIKKGKSLLTKTV